MNLENKGSFDVFASKLKIKNIDLDNSRLIWLKNSFIAKNMLYMFYAAPGSGKSLGAFYLALDLLKENKIDKLYYFDGDNPLATLTDRNISNFIQKFENKLRYISYTNKNVNCKTIIPEILQKLKDDTNNKENILIVFDSIRNFTNADMLSDKEVIPLMDTLQQLRDYATVWFLHHQPKQDLNDRSKNNKAYKGSTAFMDSVDEAYFVSKLPSNKRLTILFEPMKQRNSTTSQAITIDIKSGNISYDDYEYTALDIKRKTTVDYITRVINSSSNGINAKYIIYQVKALAQSENNDDNIVGDKNFRELLKRFENKYWRIKEGTYPSIEYYPINTDI
ncbi:MAG: AAA family ATPase [Campylobacter sp.]|nr:AAA family ATPase [Campylobacter sp.]